MAGPANLVVIGNENPDAGLKCKAIRPLSGNIQIFAPHPEKHQVITFHTPRILSSDFRSPPQSTPDRHFSRSKNARVSLCHGLRKIWSVGTIRQSYGKFLNWTSDLDCLFGDKSGTKFSRSKAFKAFLSAKIHGGDDNHVKSPIAAAKSGGRERIVGS
ncbi:uncharacterized protein TNCV_1924451 [Trichonephila clavipes]|nr:uncharacterized protein TNCV_1924451 [Trichonephila clavipes]